MTSPLDDFEIATVSRRKLLGYLGGVLAASTLTTAGIRTSIAAPVGKTTAYLKCTELVRRRPAVSPEQMVEHWRKVRAPLLRELPGLAQFTFNVVDQKRSPGTYDGAIEMWFASPAAYDSTQKGPAASMLHRLSEDAKLWMQPDFLAMFTRETVIRGLPAEAAAPKAKRLGLVGRQPGMEPDEYVRQWRDEHALEVDKQEGLVRYTLNFIQQPRFPSCPWDGYAELSWTDWPTFERASLQIRKNRKEFSTRMSFFHSHLLLYMEEVPV